MENIINKSPLLFSHFLNSEQLNKVGYYTYFPVLEEEIEGKKIIRTLPSDDCMAYTVTFELVTKKILKGEKNWFNTPLLNQIEPNNIIPKEKQLGIDFSQKKHKKCIFFNLLDYCYGHSLVKLLSLEGFYNYYKDTHDFFIVDFPDISDYVPKNKFNGCFLNLTFGDIKKVYNLDDILAQVKSNYETVDFPVIDAYLKLPNKQNAINFLNFYGNSENPYTNKKIISMYYRKEAGRKLWGDSQTLMITQFLSILKGFFSADVLLCVLGDKDENQFPEWIIDKRTKKYPNPMVYEYSQILANSVLTIGVIGSNLVVPSLVSSGMVVHIVQEDFTRLTATDVINYNGHSVNIAFEQVYLYEDINRPNYSPKDLAYKIVRLFEGKLFMDYRSNCIDLLRNNLMVPTQKDYILNQYSYFEYEKVRELNATINTVLYQIQKRPRLAFFFKSKLSKLILKIRKKYAKNEVLYAKS